MTSLRARLLASLIAVVALAAVLLAGVSYRSSLREIEALFDYQLQQMALSLRDQGEIAPGEAGAFADAGLDFVVQIWTVDGRAIYASRPHATLPTSAVLGFADVTVDRQVWRTFCVASRDRVVQVAQPRQIRERLAAGAALHSALPLLLLVPVLAAAVWWLVSTALKPLRRLSNEVTARGAEALTPLSAEGLPDEVAPLVSSLNALLQRLNTAFDVQRAFVADAAHELRTPLTALKLQVGLLRRAPDDAARAEAIDALGQGVERAHRLVEQLLTLARHEPGGPTPAWQPVDLAELARQVLADSGPQAAERGRTLGLVDAGDRASIQGDAPALAVLLRNLVDNAVRYTPPGGQVQVTVSADAEGVALCVDDSGPGLSEAEQARAFDRFWRGEASAASTAGSGLGLAIVQGIAQRHRASITLASSPLGGLRVRVRFPRA
jgi:two-component system OmpR family sensor kinase/two-component system sensor histidine kinase QseC